MKVPGIWHKNLEKTWNLVFGKKWEPWSKRKTHPIPSCPPHANKFVLLWYPFISLEIINKFIYLSIYLIKLAVIICCSELVGMLSERPSSGWDLYNISIFYCDQPTVHDVWFVMSYVLVISMNALSDKTRYHCRHLFKKYIGVLYYYNISYWRK